MRRLIGILRDAGAGTEPAAAPTLGGLTALVDALVDALGITLVTDHGTVPAPVELAAYRFVQ